MKESLTDIKLLINEGNVSTAIDLLNHHKKTVIALWVLLAVSFLFAVYKNFTAIDIHTVHETKVIEEQILDTHKIENFVENFAEVYYSWEQSAASIDNRTNALKGYLTGELQALNVDTVRKDIPVSSALTDFQIWEITEEKEQHYQVTYTVEQRITCLLYTSYRVQP